MRASGLPSQRRGVLVRGILSVALCGNLAACSLLFTPGESETARANDAGLPIEICTDLLTGITWTEQLEINFVGHGSEAGNDVPVPIRFTSADFETYKLPETPASLRFDISDGGPPLVHEVESWSPTTGGLVWVLSREYPKDGDSMRLLMLYGAPELVSSEDAPALWSQAGYTAVYHFDASDGRFLNSAAPMEAAVLLGEFPIVPANEHDALGHVISFSGADTSQIVLPDTPRQRSNTSTDSVGIEIRFKAMPPTGGERYLINKPDAYSIQSSLNTAAPRSQGNLILDDDTSLGIPGPILAADQWTFLTMSVEAAINQRLNMTVNGEATGPARSFSAPRKVSTQPFVIARGFSGLIDELRISDYQSTNSWVAQQNALLTGDQQSFGAHTSCTP